MIRIGSLIILATQLIFGFVVATVDKAKIAKGEQIVYTITAQGVDVKFPDVKKIGKYNILNVSTSSQTYFINGKRDNKISKSFTIRPLESISIPRYEVIVDRQKVLTEPIKIEVSKNASSNQDQFHLEVKLDKNELYLFEHTKLQIIFKRNASSNVADLRFQVPNIDGFWLKQVGQEKVQQQGNDIYTQYDYILSPQKVGNYKISDFFIDVGERVNVRTFLGVQRYVDYKRLYANEVKVQVRPIPGDLSFVGDFTIKAYVDKTSVKANEPINMTIRIEGEGNFEDIPNFTLRIPGVSIYADDAEKSSNNEKGFFEQKLALIAGTDYVIEPLQFRFFSLSEQTEKTISTQSTNIAVLESQQRAPSVIKTAEGTQNIAQDGGKVQIVKQDETLNYLYFFAFGFIVAYFLRSMIYRYQSGAYKNCNICLRIFTSIFGVRVSDKEALNILISSGKQSEQIKDFIDQLENKIYKNKSTPIDYKTLKVLLYQLQEENKIK